VAGKIDHTTNSTLSARRNDEKIHAASCRIRAAYTRDHGRLESLVRVYRGSAGRSGRLCGRARAFGRGHERSALGTGLLHRLQHHRGRGSRRGGAHRAGEHLDHRNPCRRAARLARDRSAS
jgi:hypothetical protein